MIDVLGPERRRRRSVQEKNAIVQQSFEPCMTVSLTVSCSCGVRSIRKAVAVGEQVVPASELASAMK